MKQSQKQWVISQLKEGGRISRNQCLERRITRLSAIIQVLETEGYQFTPKWEGGDYVYHLKDVPKKKVQMPEILSSGEVRLRYREVPLFVV